MAIFFSPYERAVVITGRYRCKHLRARRALAFRAQVIFNPALEAGDKLPDQKILYF